MTDQVTYPKALTDAERDALAEFQFRSTEEFPWFRGDQLVARYFPGQDYFCTRQARHDELRDLCATWQAEGKIVITALSAGKSFTSVTLG